MKKIILIVCFCLIPFIGVSQCNEDHHYCGIKTTLVTNAFASLDYSESFSCLGVLGSVYLKGEIPINDPFYLVPEASLGFGVIGDELRTPISLGIGFKVYPNNDWYISMMMYPRLKVVGVGHQVYGDYAIGWITFVPNVGYKWQFAEDQLLFTEVGMSIDLTIFSNLNNYKDNFGLFFSIGYGYIIR